MNERIVCLDIGEKRIGVAVSDPTRLIASPVEVIQSVGWGPDCRRIAEICRRYDTEEVLSGLPLNMDGSEGFQAQRVRNLCAQLEKYGLKVYYQDERLTTVTAEDALLEANVSREGRRQVVDKVAAAVILQQWLDERRARAKTEEDASMSDELDLNGANEAFDDEDDSLIELETDDGETVQFEYLGALEYEDGSYIALSPVDDDAEDAGVVFMEVLLDDNDEESFEAVDDDELSEKLFALFQEMMEEAGEED